jgi:hypothetical protein
MLFVATGYAKVMLVRVCALSGEVFIPMPFLRRALVSRERFA